MHTDGDISGDFITQLFHNMTCYILTTENCGKLHEGYKYSIDWMLPQLQATKDTRASLNIVKIIQGCVGRV